MNGSSVAAISLIAALAACSPERAGDQNRSTAAPQAESSIEQARPAPVARPALPSRSPEVAPAAPNVLTLRGLADLRIGEAVPVNSSWRERGAQVPGSCRTVGSPDFPGVYAIVEEGRVRRITIGESSKVKLIEGIGTGASEAEVRGHFSSFRVEPHKYVETPAKYLTAPNATAGDPALRFEIGREGKVTLMHVGTMPVLGYVEGCA
jgi:hypothetical protein